LDSEIKRNSSRTLKYCLICSLSNPTILLTEVTFSTFCLHGILYIVYIHKNNHIFKSCNQEFGPIIKYIKYITHKTTVVSTKLKAGFVYMNFVKLESTFVDLRLW
jgi:hypothetical protein